MNKNRDISKNTYYMLTLEFKLLCVTVSRANSGKYYLTNKEAKKGYFLELKELNITLKVPFRALFNTNNKLKGIKSLSFSSAEYCLSYILGYCQLKNGSLSCYAKNGEARASGIYSKNGILKINSFSHSLIVIKALNLIKSNNELKTRFIEYINLNIDILRFNLKGDFKDYSDIILLSDIVKNCNNTVFYGYSARDDLLNDKNGFKEFNGLNNFYLNGSNMAYNNRFKATYNLKEWFISPFKCLGDCNKCKKCFKLNNKVINCLIHNKSSDIILNTIDNRSFLIELLSCYGLNITDSDLKVNKGLLSSLNTYFNGLNINIEFKKWLDFYYFITDSYELKDNIEQIDLNGLKALGVA